MVVSIVALLLLVSSSSSFGLEAAKNDRINVAVVSRRGNDPIGAATTTRESNHMSPRTAAKSAHVSYRDDDNIPTGPVILKNTTAAFTLTHNVLLRNNVLLVNNISNTNGGSGSPYWTLEQPAELVSDGGPLALSADGNDILVISKRNRVFFYRFSREDGSFIKTGWQGGFGIPRTHLSIPADWADFQVSQRGMENAFYTDAAGQNHYSKVGCDTLFVLQHTDDPQQSNRTRLLFTDGWILPSIYNFETCLPERGRLKVAGFSASASALMFIGTGGTIFTQMADFDILGFDPLLHYTYNFSHAESGSNTGGVIALPPQDTQRHYVKLARDFGQITGRITIAQTGQGNLTRELRVQGTNANGITGYFAKAINQSDTMWRFIPDATLIPQQPFLNTSSPDELIAPLDVNLTGPVLAGRYQLKISNFIQFCSPAVLDIIDHDDNGAVYSFTMHHRFQYPKGGNIKLATFVAPASTPNHVLKAIFHGRTIAETVLEIGSSGLQLVDLELNWKFTIQS